MIIEIEIDPLPGEKLLDADGVIWEVVSRCSDGTFKVRKEGDKTPMEALPDQPRDGKGFTVRYLTGTVTALGFVARTIKINGKRQTIVIPPFSAL